MTTTDWKKIRCPGLLAIERLAGEYLIYTPAGFEVRFRTYERTDGTYYALAGITLLNKPDTIFVRPHGEADTEIQALKNALTHLADLVLALGEDCNDSNMKISQSHEY